MSEQISTLFGLSRSRPAPSPRSTLARRVALMMETWRTRRILAELDAHLLKDIGISRADAQAEIARAPWDIEPRR